MGKHIRGYISEFLELKCAGDVLNIVSPVSKLEKEISESMAIIHHLKHILVASRVDYGLLDLCAGNALTSIIAAYLLPVTSVVAVDKERRSREYERVKKFSYLERDVRDLPSLPKETIIISSHPCKTASVIVDIWNSSEFPALIMIPCCQGKLTAPAKEWLTKKMIRYDVWTYSLAEKIKNANVKIFTDTSILSPCNNVIVARRDK